MQKEREAIVFRLIEAGPVLRYQEKILGLKGRLSFPVDPMLRWQDLYS